MFFPGGFQPHPGPPLIMKGRGRIGMPEVKNPREIKKRIKSVGDTEQLTKAMKMVASVRFKRAFQMVSAGRPYSKSIRDMVADVGGSLGDSYENPFFEADKKAKKELLLVVGSDKGLCGSYNSNVLRAAMKYLSSRGRDKVDVIAAGKKIKDYLSRRGWNVVDSFLNLYQDFNYGSAMQVSERLTYAFTSGEYYEVTLMYSEFKNAAQAVLKTERLFPLKLKGGKKQPVDYIYEPKLEQIMEVLLPKYIKVSVYEMLVEANASEQGLRMTSMEQANRNARDMIRDLTLVYNKARQGSITRELADLVGGAAAVS